MSNEKITIARIDLNAISIKADTLHFDTADGPKRLRFKTVEGMAEMLNYYADQFVPIYSDSGKQINPYYGDKSLGMRRPGRAFYVDKNQSIRGSAKEPKSHIIRTGNRNRPSSPRRSPKSHTRKKLTLWRIIDNAAVLCFIAMPILFIWWLIVGDATLGVLTFATWLVTLTAVGWAGLTSSGKDDDDWLAWFAWIVILITGLITLAVNAG